jgi:predicted metalloprotease
MDALQPKMNDILEDGDLDEALSAHAVGDDAIHPKCKAHCPESTHGTSEQRKYYL